MKFAPEIFIRASTLIPKVPVHENPMGDRMLLHSDES